MSDRLDLIPLQLPMTLRLIPGCKPIMIRKYPLFYCHRIHDFMKAFQVRLINAAINIPPVRPITHLDIIRLAHDGQQVVGLLVK